MNIFGIRKAYKEKSKKNWPKLYWLIDLHNTIIKGNYDLMNESRKFPIGAQEVLQYLTKQKDQILILWSSSHHVPIVDILIWFLECDITFTYYNENIHLFVFVKVF